MGRDQEAKVRASGAGHADLGPGYEDAVAEGLVERIGAEIDKRIDVRLGQFGTMKAPGPPAGATGPAGAAGPADAGGGPGAAGPAGSGAPGGAGVQAAGRD